MAFKTHINNSTGNQAGQTSTLITSVVRAGVYDKDRTDFKVTGTAGMSVDVAKGEAFVENSNYVYGSQDQKFFSVASSATESVTITANSSGNSRIDIICIKVDTAATPGTQGSASSSVVAVAGTPAASPVAPATPSDHLLLATITVASGATSIPDGVITDSREEYRIQDRFVTPDGWLSAQETWTYASADSPTFTFTISGDKTTKYSAGMRIKLTQTTAKYFIITKVAYSSPNTTVTIYGGTDYTLANATITIPFYSREKAPAGFPLNQTKWRVMVKDSTQRTQANAVVNTWYNIGSTNQQITVPIGLWNLGYWTRLYIIGNDTITGFAMEGQVTLSTANNTESNADFTSTIYSRLGANSTTTSSSDYNFGVPVTYEDMYEATSKTTLYLNARNTYGGLTPDISTSPVTKIWAVCAYL